MTVPTSPHPTSQHREQYRQGRLPPDEAAAVEAHLRACPECLADDTARQRAQEDTAVLPEDAYRTVVGPLDAAAPGARPAPDESLPPTVNAGQSFGDYELLEFIAGGGMGVVYKARQRSLNRVVALKMIRGDTLDTEQAVQRFYQEARAAASLDHPNIVPIYEIGAQGGRHFFTMAYVPGTRLGDRVKGGRPLPAREAVELLLPVVDAVGFAHRHGIIHRDLKPDNVLLDAQGRPRVTDFGLAKHLETSAHLTTPGTVLGTPEYMAPEQALGHDHKIGPATDVYALGGILYFLLTARPPFAGGTTTEVLSRLLVEPPVPPRQHNPDIPPELNAICVRCLSKDPAERYPTAEAFRDTLTGYLNGQPSAAPPPPVVAPTPTGGRGYAMLALTGAVAAALVVGWAYWPNREPEAQPPVPGRDAAPVAAANARPDRFEWPALAHNDFPLQVELLGGKAGPDGVQQLTPGETIALRITSARDAYVGVWTMDGKGEITQLFPNEHEKFHRLQAGMSRVVPGEASKDYWIEAVPSEGTEYIRVIATSRPWEVPQGKQAGPYLVFNELEGRKQLDSAVRGLLIKTADKGQKDAVSEAELRFAVGPRK